MSAPTPIYLDHAATSPLRKDVLEAMLPILQGPPANPGSQHRFGRRASAQLEAARSEAALTLGVPSSWIYFVRGGTEGDNLAILGGVKALQQRVDGEAGLVISAVEHSAVWEPAHALQKAGVPLTTVDLRPSGHLNWEDLPVKVARRPALYSFMAVNNETGHRLPIQEVGERARACGGWFHTDLVQAVGRIPLELAQLPVDMATLSGHKLGGPMGTGILMVREGVTLEPLLKGGGQERGVRPGTQDVAGAVGMARALRLAVASQKEESQRLETLRNRLEAALLREIPGLSIHGGNAPRAPHILNVGVPGVERETLHMALDLAGVAASPGSACSSGGQGPGRILQALYGQESEGRAPLRFSLGHTSTQSDMDEAARRTGDTVRRLRVIPEVVS
ncbi:MAG: cysteine desulfurase family protein [Gemmatimonadota bacterium]